MSRDAFITEGRRKLITIPTKDPDYTFAPRQINLGGNSIGIYAQNTFKYFDSDEYVACVLTNYFHC